MEHNFEEMKEPLLEHLALFSVYGITVAELFEFAIELHKKTEAAKLEASAGAQPQSEADPPAHVSDSPEADEVSNGTPAAEPARVLYDGEWKASLWKWLTSIPDFWVGSKGEGKKLSLEDIEALPLLPFDESLPDGGDDGQVFDITSTRPTKKHMALLSWKLKVKAATLAKAEGSDAAGSAAEYAFQPLIYASEKKVWLTITGKTKDLKEVPQHQYDLLCAISAIGKSGVNQPALAKFTAQGKTSIQRRIEGLEKKNLVEKRVVSIPKCVTVHITLKKFVNEDLANGTHYTDKIAQPIILDMDSRELSLVPGFEYWTGEAIYEDAFIHRILDLAETWGSGGGINYNDAKTKMGLMGRKRHMKVFAKRIRTLCNMGIISKGKSAVAGTNRILHNVIKFLRRPTKEEWEQLMRQSQRKESTSKKGAVDEDDVEEPEFDIEDEEESADEDVLDEAPRNSPRPSRRPRIKSPSTTGSISNGTETHATSNSQITAGGGGPYKSPQPSILPNDPSNVDDQSAGGSGEPSKSPQPLILANDPSNVDEQSAEGSGPRLHSVDEPGPSEEIVPPSISADPPKPAKRRGRPPSGKPKPEPKPPGRRGRPPGRLDSAPRPKYNTAARRNDGVVSIGQDEDSEGARPIQDAIFTPHEDLQFEAGVAGVYINPPIEKKKKVKLLAVFKTNRLKTWVPGSINSMADTDVAEPSQAISGGPMEGNMNVLQTSSLQNESYTFSDAAPHFTSIPSAQNGPNLSKSLGFAETSSGVDTLADSLKIADRLQLAGHTESVAALWNNTPGKLCLSDDKESVLFFAAETTLPTSPALTIPISEILEYPTVSNSTSNSGEFKIQGKGCTYTFVISASDEALLAADVLRAKIVTIFSRQGIKEKKKTRRVPSSGGSFQCEHCLLTYTSEGGLLYHQTVSKTSCNPNHVPKPKVTITPQNPDVVGSRRRDRKTSTAPSNHSETLQATGADMEMDFQASGSVDELLADGSKRKAKEKDDDFVPERNPKRQRVKAPDGKTPTRRSRSKKVDTDMDVDMGTGLDTPSNPVPKGRKPRPSKAKSAPAPNSQQSLRGILFELVEANGGVFPGDPKCIWVAIATEMQKRFPGISHPVLANCMAVLKSLIDGRKVKKLSSYFQSDSGIMIKMIVITQMSVTQDSEAIEALKSQIRESHPDYYLPLQCRPSDSLMKELDNIVKEQTRMKNEIGVLSNPYYVSKAAERRAVRPRFDDEDDSEIDRDHDLEHEPEPEPEPDHEPEPETPRPVVEEEPEEYPVAVLPDVRAAKSPATIEKKRKKYERKPRLPEVITYMQSEGDPTWSSQPYGHGARPIYSRPGRRVEGNPATDIRLRKLQDGHRPFIEPRNRMIAPSRPSALLNRARDPRKIWSDFEFVEDNLIGDDEYMPTSKRRKLSSTRGGSMRGRGRGRRGTYQGTSRTDSAISRHIPHERPVNMQPPPIIIPPALNHSAAPIVFLPPNTNLDDGVLREGSPDEDEFFDHPYAAANDSNSEFGSSQSPDSRALDPSIRFADIESIYKTRGQYQTIPLVAFENSSCSYSLGEPVVSKAFILDQLLPHSLKQILSTKTGRRSQSGRVRDPQYVTFMEHVDTVWTWELANEQLLSQGLIAPDIRKGINHGFEISEWQYPNISRPIHLDWNAGEALTWFNPPWEEEGDYKAELLHRERMLPSVRPTRTLQLKDLKTRKLTHFKGDFECNDDMSGVPIAEFVEAKAAKKGVKVGMSAEMENRFIVANIAIHTIAGGVARSTDSLLVAQLFPRYTIKKSQELWKKLKNRRGKEIPIIQTRFQEAFLEAYEDGEFPALDYDDLINYDWGYVVDWYMKKFPVVSGAVLDGLPSTISSLLESCEIEDMQPTENWRDLFTVEPNTSKSKRHQVAARDQLTVSLHPARSSTISLNQAEIAKSVVRAAVFTENESYDPQTAKKKLDKIGEAAIARAKDDLVSNKVIRHKNRGRAVPRQPYYITERFTRPLQKQGIKSSCFPEARDYKQELDSKFREGLPVKIDQNQADGAFMCITNLLANDRIRLVQSRVPVGSFGLLVNSYETNSIDKNQLLFDLDIVPTESYVYNDQLNLPSVDVPHAVGDAIPAWIDINGQLIPDFWLNIQQAMLSALALRSGANIKELTRTFNPTLMEWEVRLFLEWGVKAGAVVQIASGFEGWTTGEWWWLIPGL